MALQARPHFSQQASQYLLLGQQPSNKEWAVQYAHLCKLLQHTQSPGSSRNLAMPSAAERSPEQAWTMLRGVQ